MVQPWDRFHVDSTAITIFNSQHSRPALPSLHYVHFSTATMSCKYPVGLSMANANIAIAHNPYSSPARVPAVPNATATPRLSSGSAARNGRREHVRSNALSSTPHRIASGSSRHSSSTTTINTPAQMLPSQQSRQSRQRTRAIELLSGATRTPSPYSLRRDSKIEGASGSSSAKTNLSSLSAIEELRKSLQMTKIRQDDGPSKKGGDATATNTRSQPNDSFQTRPRRGSEPGLGRYTEAVAETKYMVP